MQKGMSSRCHKRFQLPTGIVLALLAVVSIWTAAEETHANDQLPPKSEVEKASSRTGRARRSGRQRRSRGSVRRGSG